MISIYRAISADRRGVEPDKYVFQVPEHEEGPLGPLRITDRRGNIRTENVLQFREPTQTVETSPNTTNPSSTQSHRRSVLARLFARRKNDSQESSLVKGSTSTDDSNLNRTTVTSSIEILTTFTYFIPSIRTFF